MLSKKYEFGQNHGNERNQGGTLGCYIKLPENKRKLAKFMAWLIFIPPPASRPKWSCL